MSNRQVDLQAGWTCWLGHAFSGAGISKCLSGERSAVCCSFSKFEFFVNVSLSVINTYLLVYLNFLKKIYNGYYAPSIQTREKIGYFSLKKIKDVYSIK